MNQIQIKYTQYHSRIIQRLENWLKMNSVTQENVIQIFVIILDHIELNESSADKIIELAD